MLGRIASDGVLGTRDFRLRMGTHLRRITARDEAEVVVGHSEVRFVVLGATQFEKLCSLAAQRRPSVSPDSSRLSPAEIIALARDPISVLRFHSDFRCVTEAIERTGLPQYLAVDGETLAIALAPRLYEQLFRAAYEGPTHPQGQLARDDESSQRIAPARRADRVR